MRSIFSPFKIASTVLVASFCMCMMQATNWNGGIISSGSSNIDTNFSISNANIIQGPVRVAAVNADVVATIGPNAVLLSSDAPGGQLFITAAVGRTVLFDMTNADLFFVGAVDKITRLLVSFSGDGQLVFMLGNGRRVAFSSSQTPTPTAGANFFVNMGTGAAIPTVTFTRSNENSIENVEIIVGGDSLITYLADRNDPLSSRAHASIQFDPSNRNSTGSMILRVLNTASVDISGHPVQKNPLGEFTNADVALDQLAGRAANFGIINTGQGELFSRLTVVNTNKVFPYLRSEPFCDDSFTGYLPGFVLGGNGVFTTGNATYLDYVAGSLNSCPGAFVCDVSDADLADKTRLTTKKELTRSSCVVSFDDEDLDVDELLNSLDLDIPQCNVCGDADGGCECVQFVRAADCFIKARNPSAFFVDGVNHADCVTSGTCEFARINMEGCSGIYFKSGVDNCGELNEADGFIINPMGGFNALTSRGVGNIVFDIEGSVVVQGDSADSNAIRLLSTQVAPVGCPVIIESETTCPTLDIFPALTHAQFDGEFLRYNRGAFLINNRLEFRNASLVHTDDNHAILERDDLDWGDPRIFSEPTYIGGEYKRACKQDAPRPTIALVNSIIRFHESAGFTGVDIQVPNFFTPPNGGNESFLRFYSNGTCVDRGNGRIVILGTDHGDRSCRSGKVIDHNAHLDVFQTSEQPSPSEHILRLDTNANDPCFTVAVTTTVNPNESSIQTIYLGNESNISVGTDPELPVFAVATRPMFIIDGAFFSFETQGGAAHLPELTGTLGEGGIFVDTNGVFKNEDRFRANISTMVTRSGNGVVDLPQTDIFFDSRVGVTDWQPTMTVDNILVKPGESFSDFTIDWMQVITDCQAFVPYDPKMTPLACNCPPVTEANLTLLPTILGTVDQLQVKRSRLGDQITLEVGLGGFVRELVFLNGFNSAEAAMGTLVVDNWGRIGLGSAKRNYDSNDANIKLGINGITVIAKGDGVIELNEDIIIDNVCHIMPGPDFGAEGTQTLVFFSDDEKEFRVKSTGVLDLSAFRGPNRVVEFGGNMRIVFEPGAKLLLSNAVGDARRTHVLFTDTVKINFERVFDTDILRAIVPNAVEDRLVKFIGNGDITMNEGASLLLANDTFLSIETDPNCTALTDIRWTLQDQATFNVGDVNDLGGTFQVGNRTNRFGNFVNFELILNGVGTEFQIRRQGLVLFGVGGVSVEGNIPNNYTYECLQNVENVAITLLNGTFTHNQIFPGDNPLASLLVIGSARNYTFSFDVENVRIRGGANMALVSSCPTTAFPIRVLEFSGTLPGNNYSTGLFSSKDLLQDRAVFPTPYTGLQTVTGRTASQLFDYLRVRTHTGYFSPKSTIALNSLNLPTLGYIINNTSIQRDQITNVYNSSGIDTDYDRSIRRGAVNVTVLEETGDVLNVEEIAGAV